MHLSHPSQPGQKYLHIEIICCQVWCLCAWSPRCVCLWPTTSNNVTWILPAIDTHKWFLVLFVKRSCKHVCWSMQYLNLPSIFGPRMVHKGEEQGINGLSVLYNQEHKLDDYLIIIINRMLSKLKKDPRTWPLVPTMNQVFSKQVLCEIHNPWEYLHW